ncbi:MAG: hypothetical protein JWN62_4008 [Acidimicrobiales bacterium]|nr:hypothetical protein [Acidimicrobiales bacterium]
MAAALFVVGCTSSADRSSATTPPPFTSAAAATNSSPAAPTTEAVENTDVVTTTVVTTTLLASSVPGVVTTTTAVQPVTAESIAAEIAATERGIRDVSVPAASVAAFGRRQQRAYQLLARHPGLSDAVTALIPADVAVAFGLNVAARQAVADHASGSPPAAPSPTLPAWTIVEPRPIDELLADYHEGEAATGVPWQYLAAINFVETRMGRISGSSSAGAEGPMQFLPETFASCCTGDIDDPHDAIIGAATYLAASGAPGDMLAALYTYNPNEGYVRAVIAYASNLVADPLAYRGYHAWEVYVGSVAGTVRLPVGYAADAPIDAGAYARAHPDDVT